MQESWKVTLSAWCCHCIGWPIPAAPATTAPAPFGAARQMPGWSQVLHHHSDLFLLFIGGGHGLSPTLEKLRCATFISPVLQVSQMHWGWLRGLMEMAKRKQPKYLEAAVYGIFGIWTLSTLQQVWFQETSSDPSSPLKEIFAYFHPLRNFPIIKNLLVTSRIMSAARSSWGKDAGISWHGCPSRQMSAISSLGPTLSLFAFAHAEGKIHPSKPHKMLIRLHMFKKDRIYPSDYMLIPFFFFVE